MDLFTQSLTGLVLSITVAGTVFSIARFIHKRNTRIETGRITRALTINHTLFTALEHIPNGLVSRDLRRGLVLLLTHHIAVLQRTNARHPHLQDMQSRTAKLNKLPSGLQTSTLRSKVTRRQASVALEEVAKMVKEATQRKELQLREGTLAHASATFASQQIAVDTARQAANDAENIRAYPQALSFARQAHALCRRLPPIVGKVLTEATTQDIQRLERLTNSGIRI